MDGGMALVKSSALVFLVFLCEIISMRFRFVGGTIGETVNVLAVFGLNILDDSVCDRLSSYIVHWTRAMKSAVH